MFLATWGIIALNLITLALWGYLSPIARYNRQAFELWREAGRVERHGKTTEAFHLYERVADQFPLSPYAERAAYVGPRLALRDIGALDLAEEGFRSFRDRFPDSPHAASARKYQEILEKIRPFPEIARWEFVQAMVEEERGQSKSAIDRYIWLEHYFPSTPIGAESKKRREFLQNQELIRLEGGMS